MDGERSAHAFAPRDAQAVYRAIFERRDMRHFTGGTVLRRLLRGAQHAPSVGLMQPWRFIRVTTPALRQQLHLLVGEERRCTARALGEREEEFMRLKVQGLLEAAEVLAVALADGRECHIFGRRTLPQMDLASAACAIQNLWLAARAEGLGMGWVSLFEPQAVAALLELPTAPSRSRCCAWDRCRPFTQSRCWCSSAGRSGWTWQAWCTRTAGAGPVRSFLLPPTTENLHDPSRS